MGGRLVLSDEIAEAGYFAVDELPADMFPEQRALAGRVLGGGVSTAKDTKR